jgi:hypothetical protein
MQTLSIGRDASNNVVLNDKMVSRHHAQLIIMDNGQVMIKDLGSSNGSYLNGNRITETYLKQGDVVKCGGTFVNWSQYVNGNQSGNLHQKSGVDSYQMRQNNQLNFSTNPINIDYIRHEKEKTYFIIKMIFSFLIWGAFLGGLIFLSLIAEGFSLPVFVLIYCCQFTDTFAH